MKRKIIHRQVNLAVTIHAEADIQKAVTQIHLAAGKASKGGQVEITIVDPNANGEVPVSKKQADKHAEELKAAQDRIKALEKQVQELQDKPKAQTPAEQQPEASGEPTGDPGAQNQPPGDQSGKEIPELVKKAQEKIDKGKIPNAKERKALEDWEKANQ